MRRRPGVQYMSADADPDPSVLGVSGDGEHAVRKVVRTEGIALGQIEAGIAGGTDTTSDAPVAISDRLRKKLMKVNAARDTKAKLLALADVRPGDIGLEIPQNGEPRTGLSMGNHQALTALEWQISR